MTRCEISRTIDLEAGASMRVKDSGLPWANQVPNSWSIVPLKQLVNFTKGKNAQRLTAEYISYHAGDFPVYSGQTQDGGVMGLIDSFDYDLPEVLFTTTVGAKVMTPMTLHGRFSLSQNCLIAIPHGNRARIRFLYYALFPLFEYERASIPDHMQPSLRVADMMRYKIPLPSRVDQDAIVSFLDEKTAEADGLVEKYAHLVELLEEKRIALITHAITQGLNQPNSMKDSGVRWIGEIPAHWPLWKVSRAFKTIGSGTTPPAGESEWYGGLIPFITTSELRENVITEAARTVTPRALQMFTSLKIYPKDTVLVAMYGATIGRTGLLGVPATVNQACCALGDSEIFYAQFILYWLRAYRRDITSMAFGGGQPNISQDLIRSLIIPAPPIQEQMKIVDYLDSESEKIDELVKLTKRAIEHVKEQRSALITAAVTGQLDVTAYRSEKRPLAIPA